MEVSNAYLHQVAMAGLPLEEALIRCPKLQQGREEELEDEEEEIKKKKMVAAKPEAPEQSLKCPRCDSSNTKFCYYNNYSLNQPRYFCKDCRRYWTKGGSLRNVPVGGGCRKSKKSCSSSKRPQDNDHLHHQHHRRLPFVTTNNCAPLIPPPPLLAYEPSELSSALAGLQKQQQLLGAGHTDEESGFLFANTNHGVLLDMLRTDGLFLRGYDEEGAAAGGLLPFGGGAAATTTSATTVTACANEGGGDCRSILGWDSGRDPHDNFNYWNTGGSLVCSNWLHPLMTRDD